MSFLKAMSILTRNSKPIVSEKRSYVLRTQLQGQQGAVTCLKAHPMGTHVAAGGKWSSIWTLEVC